MAKSLAKKGKKEKKGGGNIDDARTCPFCKMRIGGIYRGRGGGGEKGEETRPHPQGEGKERKGDLDSVKSLIIPPYLPPAEETSSLPFRMGKKKERKREKKEGPCPLFCPSVHGEPEKISASSYFLPKPSSSEKGRGGKKLRHEN